MMKERATSEFPFLTPNDPNRLCEPYGPDHFTALEVTPDNVVGSREYAGVVMPVRRLNPNRETDFEEIRRRIHAKPYNGPMTGNPWAGFKGSKYP
jgi:hypothetical protein